MVLHTGMRTDIPAFYTPWFLNRLRAGEVMVRNPFNPMQVTKYRLDPMVVDLIGFCTKNPAPMLPHMEMLALFGQFWYVTITPYGTDVEPHVPPWQDVADAFADSQRSLAYTRLDGGMTRFFWMARIQWHFIEALSLGWRNNLPARPRWWSSIF